MNENAAGSSGGLDFADSSRDELLSHVMLQRKLIRRLYRKIVDLEGELASAKAPAAPVSPRPVYEHISIGAAAQSPRGVLTNPSGHPADAFAGRDARIDNELTRIDTLLRMHDNGVSPLDSSTTRELENLQVQLRNALLQTPPAREVNNLQKYMQQAIERGAEPAADRGGLFRHEVDEPQYLDLRPNGSSGTRQLQRHQSPSHPLTLLRVSQAAPAVAERPTSPRLHRDFDLVPEKLLSPKKSGTYQRPVAQQTPPPTSLLRLLQQRYTSPRAGPGDTLLSSPRSSNKSPVKSTRRQRLQ